MCTTHGTVDAIDGVFDALSHPDRQRILRGLRMGSATSVAALVSELVGAEIGGRRPDRTRIEVALHHRHLPKMADAGVIDYDPESGTVETTEATVVARELLRREGTGNRTARTR